MASHSGTNWLIARLPLKLWIDKSFSNAGLCTTSISRKGIGSYTELEAPARPCHRQRQRQRLAMMLILLVSCPHGWPMCRGCGVDTVFQRRQRGATGRCRQRRRAALQQKQHCIYTAFCVIIPGRPGIRTKFGIKQVDYLGFLRAGLRPTQNSRVILNHGSIEDPWQPHFDSVLR